MLKFISKFIPVSIQIKTLYWRRKEQEMDWDLSIVGQYIDEGCYDTASTLIDRFRNKWESQKLPLWLSMKTAEISRLEAINSVLKEPLNYEE
jgi:hypothetical protein